MHVEVRLAKPLEDYPHIWQWYSLRKMPVPPLNWIPWEHSYMALVDDKPICMKSLICTNTVYAMTEYAIADPRSSAEERIEAIGTLNEVLLDEAKRLGYEFVTMFSNMPRTWEKASDSGFTEVGSGYKMLTRKVD